MAAFVQNFTITPSSDFKKLLLADSSNMGDNDEGYDYTYFNTTKNFGVYDSSNVLLGSLIPFTSSTPVEFNLDKDRYLVIKQTLQHNSDTPLIKQYTIVTSYNVDLKLGTFIIKNILDENGVLSEDNNDNLFNIIKATLASNIFAQTSNGTLSQDMLDLANSYTDCDDKFLN